MDPKDLNPELKTLHDAIQGVPEAVEAMKKHAEDVAAMQKKIEELETLNKTNFQAPAKKEDDRSAIEKGKDGEFSWGAFIRGVCLDAHGIPFDKGVFSSQRKNSKSWRDAGFTATVMAEEKAMSTTVGSGGYFAPEYWSTQWLDILAAKAVAIPQCERWTGLSNADVRMGRLATGATGYWIAEGSQITISSPTDEQVSVAPHEAAARVQVSNQLLKLSNPAIESVVMQNMEATLARLVDLAILEGSGSSNQPTGIATGAGSTVTSSGAMTWALLEEFAYDLAVNNAPMGKVCWFMPPRTMTSIRQLTTSNYPQFVGTPTGQALGRDLAGGGLLGYPVYTSSQMTITGGTGSDATVLLADMSECILADWGPPEFAASKEIVFDYNSTQLRAIWLVDVALKHANSFVACTDTTS